MKWHMKDQASPSGRFEALLLQQNGSVRHLGARQGIQEAIDDADAKGPGIDAQVIALSPRRVVAFREAGNAWLTT